jgi:hypothetical protein
MFSEKTKQYIPTFNYILFDLSTFSDTDILGPIELTLSFTDLRDIHSDDPDILKQMITRLISFIL